MNEPKKVRAFVGIEISDPDFVRLSKRDKDFIRGLAVGRADAQHRFQLILFHGQLVGYGIPLTVSKTDTNLLNVDADELAVAVDVITRLTRKIFEPLLHRLE